MTKVEMTIEEYMRLIGMNPRRFYGDAMEMEIARAYDRSLTLPEGTVTKPKRKPSKYNREYARQFAILKKKHPRTQFKTLVKRAHAKTKKKLK